MKIDKGMFITFEGGEGAGKTTQLRLLKSAFEQQGYSVVTTREPGGTPEAEKIRDMLVQRDGGNWDGMSECLLLYAARKMHVDQVIRPALAAGKIVICDRFADSTLAYQGYGHGTDLNFIHNLHHLALGNFWPDLTFIFDIPAPQGLARSKKQKDIAQGKESTEDRMENMHIDFHERLRQGFLAIAKLNAARCHVIDATRDIEIISSEIWRVIERTTKNAAV